MRPPPALKAALVAMLMAEVSSALPSAVAP